MADQGPLTPQGDYDEYIPEQSQSNGGGLADSPLVNDEPGSPSGQDLENTLGDSVFPMIKEGAVDKDRPLDFIRERMAELKHRNFELENRCADLEHTLSIVQTAQSWSRGNAMTSDQAQKLFDVTRLLMQVTKAKKEALSFSQAGKGQLNEKIVHYKHVAKQERSEKKEMRERLQLAFRQSNEMRKKYASLKHKYETEQEGWKDYCRKMRESFHRSVFRLQQQVDVKQDDSNRQAAEVLEYYNEVSQQLQSMDATIDRVQEDHGFDEDEEGEFSQALPAEGQEAYLSPDEHGVDEEEEEEEEEEE